VTDRQPVTPDDLRTVAALGRAALEPALDKDWTVLAREMEWTCRQTLDHLPDALGFYAANLATRATGPRPHPRNGDPARSVAELLLVLESAAAVLAAVAEAAPPGTRAFHPAGIADAEGFLAMGCAEILLHTDDIAAALGVPFEPPAGLCARITRRIFPWAPAEGGQWDALRWAGGRIALPDRLRLDANWWWHCAPLEEWDGTINRRTAPPVWR
jgi:hypothetical protein